MSIGKFVSLALRGVHIAEKGNPYFQSAFSTLEQPLPHTESSFIEKSEPVYPDIKHVHVVNSCHLDVGFGSSIEDVVNLYFDHHIPLVVDIGAQLRKGVDGFTDDKLNFMFHSWVLDLYFNCPTGLGLHCPSVDEQAQVRGAIEKGDITWSAFPFDAQFEIMDPALIKAGLKLTEALDKEFQQKPKATVSQRDVPGMTRAIIPLLKEQGVSAMSVGVNEASTAPDLPPCFVWKDPQSDQSLLGLYTWPGYGTLPISGQKLCIVDGFDHVLVYNIMFDNAGPLGRPEGYAGVWREIAESFPNAEIHSSTLDEFTKQLETVKHKLPVIDKEIGDTWIYGVPSDPQKLSRMRVINRAYADVDRQSGIGSILAQDSVLRNATRFALKLFEHTWGKDVKKSLEGNNAWKNVEFMQAQSSAETAEGFSSMESSWWEQRHWGITVALDTLKAADHPMAQTILKGFEGLEPKVPSTDGYELVKSLDVFKCGSTEIGFDESGSISHLLDDGYVWADDVHKLLQLKYRSYSADDVSTFFSQYLKVNATWVDYDYGKPGLPSDVQGKVWTPTLNKLYRGDDNCSFLLQTSFDPEASENYGAAPSAWIALDVSKNGISVTISMFDKKATRLPESMFVQFLPASSYGSWSVNKLDSWMPASEVIDGGAKHLHGAMEGGLRLSTGEREMMVSSLDAALVNFGELTAYPSPVYDNPDTENFGGSFILWDNLWGTNYVMWWPFVATPPAPYTASDNYFPAAWNDDMVSRFRIAFNEIDPDLSSVRQRLVSSF